MSRFQWARCQITTISDCLTEGEIKYALKTLPKDLNETYERMLRKILDRGGRSAELVRRVLLWIMGSRRPLRLLELQEAVMIEPESKQLNESYRVLDPFDILKICGSFVQSYIRDTLESDHLNPRGVSVQFKYLHVRLSHYTVQVCFGPTMGNSSRILI